MFYILLLTKALKSCMYFILMENLSLLVTFQMLNSHVASVYHGGQSNPRE